MFCCQVDPRKVEFWGFLFVSVELLSQVEPLLAQTQKHEATDPTSCSEPFNQLQKRRT